MSSVWPEGNFSRPAEPWDRKYTLILSFIAFSTAIYGQAIGTECKSNPLPAIFYLLFEARDRKALFVLFFVLFVQRGAADCC